MGQSTALKSAETERDVGARAKPKPARFAMPAAVVVLLVAFPFFADSYWLYLAVGCLIFAVIACGQDLLVGMAGQASFGGAAFMAIGAYAVAEGAKWHLTAVGALALAAVAGAVIGFIVGLPSLRLKGFYLLLSTLALQAVVSFLGAQYQGKSGAGIGVDPPSIGSFVLDNERDQYFASAVILVLVALFLRRLYRGTPGRAWRAIHESELAASSVGVQVVWWKLSAFVWSSTITALGGGMYAYYVTYVSISTFSVSLAVSLLTIVFVGGRQSLGGVSVGAVLVTLLPAGIQQLSSHLSSGSSFGSYLSQHAGIIDTGIFAIALFAVLVLAPDGLAGITRTVARLAARTIEQRLRKRNQPQLALSNDPDLLAEPRIGGLPAAAPLARADAILIYDNVSVRYANGAIGIENASLAVARGSFTAIFGRNGAGKTSLLRAAVGFLPTEHVRVSGSVLLDGRPLDKLGPGRRGVAGVILVPERDKAFPTLTVREHLQLVGAKDAQDVLDLFPPLKQRSSSVGAMLSGGERQMLAIATSVARRPKVLLVDEMSLGLAPIIVTQVLEQLLEAKRELGLTVVVVDQDVNSMLRVSDSICVVEESTVGGLHDADQLSVDDLGIALIGSSAAS
jgi:branched-chain amino acid transport system permease protein